ncbi:MAG TPA: histidine kinase dimerization/phospho-acceptor domain-containing protein [Candidatus Obscuribacterales bacterium]
MYKEADELKTRMLLAEQREEFMGMLAHDLKNPLIGADRLLEILCEGTLGELTPSQLEVLIKLRRSNESMLDLVQGHRLRSPCPSMAAGRMNANWSTARHRPSRPCSACARGGNLTRSLREERKAFLIGPAILSGTTDVRSRHEFLRGAVLILELLHALFELVDALAVVEDAAVNRPKINR